MRKPFRFSSFFSNLILVIALTSMWFAFAPTNLGGRTSYVIVQGNSMEPDFHLGDLAIIRTASSYKINDIVTYWDEIIQAHVIHRIIAIEQDRFILQGDNNGWIDTTQPSSDDILGKLWIHIPHAGKFMDWMKEPINFALTITLFGGIVMTTLFLKPRNAQKKHVQPSYKNYIEIAVYLLGFALLASVALLLYAFNQPTSIPASATLYQQEGRFHYSATSIPGIYDEATIRSGEPIFTTHTCLLNLSFSYYISGTQMQDISGNHQLYARVTDEKSGWQRSIPVNQDAAFSGNAFASTGVVDLCQVQQLINTLEEQTGMRANYKMEIIAPVLVTGNIAGQAVTDTFVPKLTFRFDDVHFYLDSIDKSADAFIFTKVGVNNSILSTESNRVSFLGLAPTVLGLRVFSIIGLFFSLGGFGIVAAVIYSISQKDPDFLRHLKYGNLLVDVQSSSFEPTSPIADVDSMSTLAKLAERHNTMILHVARPLLHDYLVQTTQVTYRYSINRVTGNAMSYEKQYHHKPQYAQGDTQPVMAQQQDSVYAEHAILYKNNSGYR